uniref:HECT-type E3 ubiquitin transferase n=1 Tax=Blastobotrys adeninivorans TaxID=409370 RepID=A0A060T386_BLAAD
MPRRHSTNPGGLPGEDMDDSLRRLIRMRQEQAKRDLNSDSDSDQGEGHSHRPHGPAKDDHYTNLSDSNEDHDDDDDNDIAMEENQHHDDQDEDEEIYEQEEVEDEDEEEDGDERDLANPGPRASFGRAADIFGQLSGMLSAVSSRIRPIVETLKHRDDPSEVMMGLDELADLLLVSTEDDFMGYFPVDTLAESLVSIMSDPMYTGNPEIMLLACRNVSNLMEAVSSSVTNLVHAGVVPVLCQKLLEIEYIDLAEQALSVRDIAFLNYFYYLY